VNIYDNFKADVAKDTKLTEEKLNTTEGRKWVKYAVYGAVGVLFLMIGACVVNSMFMSAPQHKAYVNENYVQPALEVQQVAAQPQPVYQNNPDPMSGVLTGMVIGSMMSNGMAYNGHNGYYDNRYRGPSRTVVVNKTVVVNRTIVTPVRTAPRPAYSAPVSRPSYSSPSRSSYSGGSSRSGRR
jgi:hypothetical protein